MNIKRTPTFKLSQITRMKRQWVDRALQRIQLSRTQWQTLIWLQISGYSAEQQDIVRQMEIDAAHLVRVLDQLEKMGYVTRGRKEGNRRCMVVAITARGRKIIRIIERVLEREQKMLFDGLSSEEYAQLVKFLNKLELNLMRALSKEEA